MLVSDFQYDLHEELIAQQPAAERGSSRMLTLDRRSGEFADHAFGELPELLLPGDLLVLNDSRVLPSRLFATRGGLHLPESSPEPSGRIEVLLTEQLSNTEGHNDWRALVRPARKIQVGERLLFYEAAALGSGSGGQSSAGLEPSSQQPAQQASHAAALRATVLATGCYGERTLRFDSTADFMKTLERIGYLPLPPYIRREKSEPNTAEDRERYQTVFSARFGHPDSARIEEANGTNHSSSQAEAQSGSTSVNPETSISGSAAAPTAGLHFTPAVLRALQARDVEIARLTLHVGLGTFQPVRVADTRDIRLHDEPYTLPAHTAAALNEAFEQGRRIVAVGTTVTRTLEHVARRFEAAYGALDRKTNPLRLQPHSGSTSLFLSPAPDGDAEFKLVQGLLTNFHLPGSTLLMLVSAFAGRDAVLRAYAHAVQSRYRFFSYGDCMLVT